MDKENREHGAGRIERRGLSLIRTGSAGKVK
jgi:hypothetical protein